MGRGPIQRQSTGRGRPASMLLLLLMMMMMMVASIMLRTVRAMIIVGIMVPNGEGQYKGGLQKDGGDAADGDSQSNDHHHHHH